MCWVLPLLSIPIRLSHLPSSVVCRTTRPNSHVCLLFSFPLGFYFHEGTAQNQRRKYKQQETISGLTHYYTPFWSWLYSPPGDQRLWQRAYSHSLVPGQFWPKSPSFAHRGLHTLRPSLCLHWRLPHPSTVPLKLPDPLICELPLGVTAISNWSLIHKSPPFRKR